MFKTHSLFALYLISTALDMMTISFYLFVRLIENSDNWCLGNWEPTVPCLEPTCNHTLVHSKI